MATVYSRLSGAYYNDVADDEAQEWADEMNDRSGRREWCVDYTVNTRD